tara:strand:+ start:581 stop:2161 length:1581 start_codon:yes stop_codon:yes gene_type:complete
MVWGTSVNLPAGQKIKAPNGKMMTEAELGVYVKNALAAGQKGKLAAVLDSLHSAGHSGSYNASEEFIDVVGANEDTGIVPASVAAAGPAAVAAHVAEHNMGPSGTQGSGQGDAWTDSAANMEKVNAAIAAGGGDPGVQGWLNYIKMNPGLREATEAHGMTQQEVINFAMWHWTEHGVNEWDGGQGGRLNTPWETNLPDEQYAKPNQNDMDTFQDFIRSGADHSLSEMWKARGGIDPAWTLNQFIGDDWNFNPDNPYMQGLLGNNIKVDTGVGQIWSEGDKRFLQDRYLDAAIANDFPVGWVNDDGTWNGPDKLAGYWSDLTNAIRNEVGDLRAIRDRPDAGWETATDMGVGDRWVGQNRPGGKSAAEGAMNLLDYRPWTQKYWTENIPKESQGLLYMGEPQREYGLSYLPGEFRDPTTWGKWADDHKGHIPEGSWVYNPNKWPSSAKMGLGTAGAMRFTSPAQLTNIHQNPWSAADANLSASQAAGWQGFLSNLGNTPLINSSPTSLLGNSDGSAAVPYVSYTIDN